MVSLVADKSSLRVNLMANTQFVYELRLAILEAQVLAGGAEMGDDLRSFILPEDADTDALLRKAAYVNEFNGESSDYARLVTRNATRSFNQYITHWFYPYKGKFHPQMTRALANIIGMRSGEVLLDPFVGSGTTAVEGSLLGLKTIGYDISPLCVLISKVKANAVHHLSKLEALASPLLIDENAGREFESAIKDPVKGFNLLALLIALSDKVRRNRDFGERIQKNMSKMLLSLHLMQEGCAEVGIRPTPAEIAQCDARQLPLESESVDGIVTSPPYSIALNYVANDKHALEFLGRDVKESSQEFIGVRGRGKERATLYEEDMRLAYAEMARVLKPGRMAAIVLGDATVEGVRLPTVDSCQETFREMGFECVDRIDKIIFGLYNVMQREDILLFRKRG